MLSRLNILKNRLVIKLILTSGILLFVVVSAWAYFIIDYHKNSAMDAVLGEADRLSNTIKLGTHYAMMLNSRDDINQIINNIAKQKDIENIRIYNKNGEIQFSNDPSETRRATNIKAEACYICHNTEPPLVKVDLKERIRFFNSTNGHRLLGIIVPICNEPGCATGACHFHPLDKKILGALDLVISLQETDRQITYFKTEITLLAIIAFLATSAGLFLFVHRFVNQPIKSLIQGTIRIGKGDYTSEVAVKHGDEIGQLAAAINRMAKEIGEKQAELNNQRDEYQNLFERVPCLITVQDRQYRLLRYNRQFADNFEPVSGDYCYHAYKGRDQKCEICPVEMTFKDGLPHSSEECGVNKDGSPVHWIVTSSPIKDSKGGIVAAMEVSLDITFRKVLEAELEKSEKKYYAIFNNMPNPVFVLDMDTLNILDCNESMCTVYGYTKEEMIGSSFLNLFKPEEREHYRTKLTTSAILDQVRHTNKFNRSMFVNIRISPSEYPGQKILLVATNDITKRLETEQQLIQAGKMAILGEMATGVAHELNQPLTVIKTASSFFIKKINKKESIREDILYTMASEIDSHVDRAVKIINHMREFGRKSEMTMTKVNANEIMERSLEIFSQQLKLRGIRVVKELDPNLPWIMGDSGRLEQVMINFLLNARDAIEEHVEASHDPDQVKKQITLRTQFESGKVYIEVHDTGKGIPPSLQNKIFEPFFTTKKVGKGTGLGLSISYGIIKDCGGEVNVTNDKDSGACFQLVFPATNPEDT